MTYTEMATFKIGDLVRHQAKDYVGVIYKIDLTIGRDDPLVYIRWAHGYSGACWFEDIHPLI